MSGTRLDSDPAGFTLDLQVTLLQGYHFALLKLFDVFLLLYLSLKVTSRIDFAGV